MLLCMCIHAINQHIYTHSLIIYTLYHTVLTDTHYTKLCHTLYYYVQGHVHESMTLLQPYLPQVGGQTGSAYSEAGALYALGLIHANKGIVYTVYNYCILEYVYIQVV